MCQHKRLPGERRAVGAISQRRDRLTTPQQRKGARAERACGAYAMGETSDHGPTVQRCVVVTTVACNHSYKTLSRRLRDAWPNLVLLLVDVSQAPIRAL